MCKKTSEMVALKVYHMENLCELNHYQVFREVRVHSTLQHQNIISLFCAFQVSRAVTLEAQGMTVLIQQAETWGWDTQGS